MRHALLLIAASFALGIAASSLSFLSALENALYVLAALGAALALLAQRRYTTGFACVLGGVLLCGAFLAQAERLYRPANHVERLIQAAGIDIEQPLEVEGWARTAAEKRPGSEIFDLQVTAVRQQGRGFDCGGDCAGAIRLYYYEGKNKPASLGVVYGARLRLALSGLRRPRNYLTPGAFDWRGYLERRGIFFSGLVRRPEEVTTLPGRAGGALRAAIYELRGKMGASIDALFGEPGLAGEARTGATPDDAGSASEDGVADESAAAQDAAPRHSRSQARAIFRAMLLGDDNWLSPAAEQAFQQSGIYHVLVISGYNVMVLAAMLLWVCARARVPQLAATLLTIGAILIFALLVNASIPVVRAAVMAVIYLVAALVYRQRSLLDAIAAAALFLLVLRPSDLFDAGFQLSFGAVLVLAAVAAPLIGNTTGVYKAALHNLDQAEEDLHLLPEQAQFRTDLRVLLDWLCGRRRQSRVRRWARRAAGATLFGAVWVAEALLFTLVMQLGFALITAIYFHRITWSGIVANLLVLPLAGLLPPLGLVTVGIAAVSFPVARAAAAPLGVLANALEQVAELAAHLVRANPRVAPPPLPLVAAFALLMLALAVLLARRSRWVWLAGTSLVLLGAALTLAPYAPLQERGKLEITALDVGQGDSIFVSFPQGKTMLIDAGGILPLPGSESRPLDVGENVVSAYLWSRRIQRIDYLVLTHAHLDHLGGMAPVLRNFSVGEFWVGPGAGTPLLARDIELAEQRGTRVVRHAAGFQAFIDGVTVTELSPPPDWRPKRVSNNDSLVLRLSYGRRHFLLPGDIESRMEKLLLKGGEPLASEVLKIAHHGSRTSTTPAFLAAVAPAFGIISVGDHSRFGHPNGEVLAALAGARVRQYRTDLDGTVTILSDGNRIEVSTFRDTARRPTANFLP